MGQMMSSTGETSSARNLVSVRQRKKKQFLRGAARSITNRQDAHAAKQMAAACAVVGNSRNRSRSFIEAPVRKLNSADQIEHGRFRCVHGLQSAGENCSRAGSRPGRVISSSCTRPARKSRCQNSVSPLDVGEIRG